MTLLILCISALTCAFSHCSSVGLGAVLYDTNRYVYFTPNTGQTTDLDGNTTMPDGTEQAIDKVLVDKELDTEFEQDGNSSDG